jgi:hypothetical protein
VLPRWAALAGFVVAVLTLLHLLLPLPAALAGLLWVASVSALFLVGSGPRTRLGASRASLYSPNVLEVKFSEVRQLGPLGRVALQQLLQRAHLSIYLPDGHPLH